MRSHETYRASRRNEARAVLKKARKAGMKIDGKRVTFAQAFADAKENWHRHEPLPKVKRRYPALRTGKTWPTPGKQEAARRLARMEARANG